MIRPSAFDLYFQRPALDAVMDDTKQTSVEQSHQLSSLTKEPSLQEGDIIDRDDNLLQSIGYKQVCAVRKVLTCTLH